MEPSTRDTPQPGALTRRTIVKGAAWSLPVIAVATALPNASASSTDVVTPGNPPTATGSCTPLSAITFRVTIDPGGVPVAGQAVVVTLPAGFSWPGGATGSRILTTDSDGVVTITGLTAPELPGTYAVLAQVAPNGATASVPVTVNGAWIGAGEGYGGTKIYPVYTSGPIDPANLGTPDHWAYCIEHNVSAKTRTTGVLGTASGYLGSNLFTDPAVQAMVAWVLEHSYPALSLADFGAAAGVPGISRNDAIEATQYAIWRYTDLGWDASWNWETPASETAYWYLVNGANAADGSSTPVKAVSVPTSSCGTPTTGDHAQSLGLV
ncbi:Cys-Gln thioester bond-forming surface protein [Microbacterium sp.]|uniref:Cys-Gln thioester bond-forming surface protein n=1 Tax=Microbacterium sp. TaxID=51671 RepID=UPI00333E47C9